MDPKIQSATESRIKRNDSFLFKAFTIARISQKYDR